MFISNIDISRLIVYVQQLEEEKLRDIEEYWNKKSKTGNNTSQQKGGSSRPQFQKLKGHAPSSTSAPTPRNSGEYNG